MASKKLGKRFSDVEVHRTQREQSPKSSSASSDKQGANGYNARWIVGLLTGLVGIFVLLAVIASLFCWKHDYAVIHAVEPLNPHADTSVSNLCGPLGARMGEWLIGQSFGLAGIIIPIILILWGVSLMMRRLRIHYRTTLSLTLVMILLSLSLGLMFGDSWGMFGSGWGGAFGIAVASLLKGSIGVAGSWILTILCWILTGVFININLINAINRASNSVIRQGGSLIDRTKERADSLLHSKHVAESTTIHNVSDEPTEGAVANVEESVAEKEQPSEPIVEGEPSVEESIAEVEQPQEEPATEPTPISAENEVEQTSEEKKPTESNIHTIVVEEHTEEQLSKREMRNRPFDPDHTPSYKYPSPEMLINYTSGAQVTDDEIRMNKARIEETLANFGIPIREMRATIGPTVTLYEIMQESGVRISRIKGLEQDIAQSLRALGIRIIAPIPGRGTIGIEVPNINKEIVSMRSAILSQRFNDFKGELPIVIGRTIQNENYVFDLAKLPHLLVAGATGQGKSVGLNAIITSLLYRKDPSQLKFVLIDPKQVEFAGYAPLERHFLAKMESEDEAIVTDPKKAVYTLNSLCIEMEKRLNICRKVGARNIGEYNDLVRKREIDDENIMPYIVVVIDEFADLIMTAKEVEAPVMRLAQKARAIGIHLIVATQRPDVKVITGGIKANFPARIAFRVMQSVDSRTIIDQPGANQLIGRGDMLFSKDGDLTRIQCALVESGEMKAIIDNIAAQPSPTGSAYLLPDYVEAGGDSASGDSGMGSESGAPIKYDSLFGEIAREAVTSGQISTSYIQRNFEVGFNRAGRIMTQLERAGIVGPQIGAKPREIKFYDLPSLEAKLQELGVF